MRQTQDQVTFQVKMDFTKLDQNQRKDVNNLSFSTMVQQEVEELRIKGSDEGTKAKVSELNSTKLSISQKMLVFKKPKNIISLKSLKVICHDCG
jgi:hypothetical protein